MKKILLLVLISALLLSCKSGKAPSENLMVDLYPDIQKITKDYYKYPIKNAFHSDYFLYSPVEPSKTNKNQPRILIPYNISLGTYYYYYFEFIKNKRDGNYTCYLAEGNTVKYRNYVRYYKEGEKKIDLSYINNYFKQAKISYKLIKRAEDGFIFLLNKNNQKEPVYCSIALDSLKIDTYIYYSAKDTINSLTLESKRPYIGRDLEN